MMLLYWGWLYLKVECTSKDNDHTHLCLPSSGYPLWLYILNNFEIVKRKSNFLGLSGMLLWSTRIQIWSFYNILVAVSV